MTSDLRSVIEIFFHKPTRNGSDESRGGSVYTGRKENFDIDMERVKRAVQTILRALAAPKSISIPHGPKEKKKNLTQTHSVRFRFLLAEMGECHSCTQQFLLPGGLYYSTKNYYVNGFP